MISDRRDMTAAKGFFRSAKATACFLPDRGTTDGHGSYPRAIGVVLGRPVLNGTRGFKSQQRSRALLP
jgi:putative transposase